MFGLSQLAPQHPLSCSQSPLQLDLEILKANEQCATAGMGATLSSPEDGLSAAATSSRRSRSPLLTSLKSPPTLDPIITYSPQPVMDPSYSATGRLPQLFDVYVGAYSAAFEKYVSEWMRWDKGLVSKSLLLRKERRRRNSF